MNVCDVGVVWVILASVWSLVLVTYLIKAVFNTENIPSFIKLQKFTPRASLWDFTQAIKTKEAQSDIR